MYGIVNKSIEELVVSNYGHDMWEEVKKNGNIHFDYFISSEIYDDAITFQLANSIANELSIPVSDVLSLFGQWWILHTCKKHYGYLLESGGDSFKSFLMNLPTFHNRVMMMYPKLTPPEFQVSNVEEQSLHLHYFSQREGLTAFVYGLIIGLGKFFDSDVSINHLESVDSKKKHEIFEVKWMNQ
jgi:hypothetical protein